MIRTILVPVDGSAFAECALSLALALSEKTGAEIRLAMVNEPLDLTPGPWAEAFLSTHVEYLDSITRSIANRLAPGTHLSSALLEGEVAHALCIEAIDSGADLIVMSTHGRGGLTRMWLGSVADAVVRRSSTPVLLVRPSEGEEPFLEIEGPKIRRILIPLQVSTLSEAAIEPALELGALFGASFTLLRVIEFPIMVGAYLPETLQSNQAILEEAETEARAYLEGVRSRLDDGSRQIDTDVVVNQQPARGILNYATANNVDLVSIATHGRGGIERTLLGSTADKVIRGANTPILIVRPVKRVAAALTESVA